MVLFDDGGREVMSAQISPGAFAWLAHVCRVHGGSMRTMAAAVRIGRALLAAQEPPPARRVAAAGGKRGGGRP